MGNKFFDNVVCPISTEKIDSNVSRLTIFFNVVLMALYIYTQSPAFIIIVAIDYTIRAVYKVKYSPIRLVAVNIIKPLHLKTKPIDLAQKVFASRLGMLCALTATVLHFTGNPTGSIVVTSILLALSTLDSVFNFCVGCLIYNYMVYPFYKKA